MIAEILSVGTELLMGQIANTDAQYISRRLSELGVNIYRHTTVGDNPARVKEAVRQALSRADIVITTGGLGPTEDDLTKEMVAETLGLEMQLHQPSLDAMLSYMTQLGRPITENNRKQAYFPVGAIVMPNRCGTAPGCIVERDGKAVAVLPGPPHRAEGHVRLRARALSGRAQRRAHRVPLPAGVRHRRIVAGGAFDGSVPHGQPHAGALLRPRRGHGAHHRPGRNARKGPGNDRPAGGGDSPPLRRLRLWRGRGLFAAPRGEGRAGPARARRSASPRAAPAA